MTIHDTEMKRLASGIAAHLRASGSPQKTPHCLKDKKRKLEPKEKQSMVVSLVAGRYPGRETWNTLHPAPLPSPSKNSSQSQRSYRHQQKGGDTEALIGRQRRGVGGARRDHVHGVLKRR
uniref:Uncharacterized protein n=1 Tax=Knipowitschia caucasica TaxID=637954 RepID=A0AAV2JNU0_KNICA